MRPFIVIGDRTDHGGVVIGSTMTTDTHGKRLARVGDGGASASTGAASSSFAPGGAKAAGLISSLLPENHDYDIHFVVRDELTGQPLPRLSYKITLEDGRSITGITDEKGLTEKISSNTKQKAALEVHHYGDVGDCGADAQGRYDACCC